MNTFISLSFRWALTSKRTAAFPWQLCYQLRREAGQQFAILFAATRASRASHGALRRAEGNGLRQRATLAGARGSGSSCRSACAPTSGTAPGEASHSQKEARMRPPRVWQSIRDINPPGREQAHSHRRDLMAVKNALRALLRRATWSRICAATQESGPVSAFTLAVGQGLCGTTTLSYTIAFTQANGRMDVRSAG